jgi:hypothetical protein
VLNPEDRIQSRAIDDMPAQEYSGLGTPMGYEDAGLPRVRTDGSVPRGSRVAP